MQLVELNIQNEAEGERQTTQTVKKKRIWNVEALTSQKLYFKVPLMQWSTYDEDSLTTMTIK